MVEMGVPAHNRECMLAAQRGDPDAVGWNRRARPLKFQTDGSVMPRGLDADSQHGTPVQHPLERPFVLLAVARLRGAERKLPGHNHRNRNLARLGHNLNCFRRSVQIGRKGVGIEDQAWSSGSICSNSSSMSF